MSPQAYEQLKKEAKESGNLNDYRVLVNLFDSKLAVFDEGE